MTVDVSEHKGRTDNFLVCVRQYVQALRIVRQCVQALRKRSDISNSQ